MLRCKLYTGTYLRPFSILLVEIGRGYPFRMSTSGSTHVERTQGSTRNDVISEVTVTDVKQLSPTTKGFTLQAYNKKLSFKPGQWVDLKLPGVDVVGGYSITSPPRQLRERGTFNLAIQYSDHAPTMWMSTKCKVGDKFSVQVGGDFWYSPPSPWESPGCAGSQGYNLGAVQLLYSSKTASELLFKQEIDRICADCSYISAQYFVTKEECDDQPGVACRRLQKDDLGRAVARLDVARLWCYICGPPPMIEDIQTLLRDLGVDSGCINFEKWW